MEALYIKETEDSAEFTFDAKKQIFQLKGTSMPENARAFFDPIIEWIIEYGEYPTEDIMYVDFMLTYFNTASAKKIMEILDELEKINNDEHKVIIRWYYDEDDDRMKEEGEGYEELCDLTFEYINELPE